MIIFQDKAQKYLQEYENIQQPKGKIHNVWQTSHPKLPGMQKKQKNVTHIERKISTDPYPTQMVKLADIKI